MKNFFNKFTNNNRIFSYQDVINMSNDEGTFFKDAIDYQARTIGLPTNEQLQMSSDVVYVHAYTRDDGTEVRAHYRSKAGLAFIDPNKRCLYNPIDGLKDANDWANKMLSDKGVITGAAVNNDEKLPRSFGSNLQKNISKVRFLEHFYEPNKPLSKEYYNISTTKGKSIETGSNSNNYKIQVGDVAKSNLPLYKHIKEIKGNKPISDDDMLVIPKQNSPMTQAVKNSNTTKAKIAQNYEAIKNGIMRNQTINNVDFTQERDLATTLGHTHIYDAHIDNKGNLNAYIVDWYDFDKMPPANNIMTIVNNNAYIQQENDDLANYAIVIKIQYTPEEQEKLFNK